MFRMSLLRAVRIAALAVAATGVLVGCGDDSTATSTPTSPMTTSTTSAAASPTETESSPVTEPGEAATEPPETPQAMPSDFPGPDAPQIGPREQGYLDELQAQGIESSGNGESAITIANYVCAAQQQGTPGEIIAVNVNAMAGVEQNLTGGTRPPEQVGTVYIDVAKKTYCQ